MSRRSSSFVAVGIERQRRLRRRKTWQHRTQTDGVWTATAAAAVSQAPSGQSLLLSCGVQLCRCRHAAKVDKDFEVVVVVGHCGHQFYPLLLLSLTSQGFSMWQSLTSTTYLVPTIFYVTMWLSLLESEYYTIQKEWNVSIKCLFIIKSYRLTQQITYFYLLRHIHVCCLMIFEDLFLSTVYVYICLPSYQLILPRYSAYCIILIYCMGLIMCMNIAAVGQLSMYLKSCCNTISAQMSLKLQVQWCFLILIIFDSLIKISILNFVFGFLMQSTYQVFSIRMQ